VKDKKNEHSTQECTQQMKTAGMAYENKSLITLDRCEIWWAISLAFGS